jgi:hypothetical protein
MTGAAGGRFLDPTWRGSVRGWPFLCNRWRVGLARLFFVLERSPAFQSKDSPRSIITPSRWAYPASRVARCV